MSSTPILLRIAKFARLVAHFASGLATLAFAFHRYSPAQRMTAIQHWSQKLLAIVQVRVEHSGTPPENGLLVMNHISWLDVFVLNAIAPSRFVSKAEVARWPLVGYLVSASGTLYIERTRKTAARRTNRMISDALGNGDRVAVFPEGTTTAGDRLLRFHAALLQPAIANGGAIHPVTLHYFDADGRRSAAVSYIDDETLVGSVWQLLGGQSVLARLQFDEGEPAAGRHRREIADTLHAKISRRLDPGEALPGPGIRDDPQAGPR
jgi:1-acyl-sn-glycerol-3-phosphate acyltransferase